MNKQPHPDLVPLLKELEAKEALGRCTSAYRILARGCSAITAVLAFRVLGVQQ